LTKSGHSSNVGHMTFIRTASGIAFDLFSPKVEDVRIADIAHALARLTRYTGHGRAGKHFSVAEHSVRVCHYAMRVRPHDDHESRAWHWAALLHDAHEAFVGDVTSPLKRAMREFVAPGDKTHFELIESPIIRTVREALRIQGGFADKLMQRRDMSIAHLDRYDLEIESGAAIGETVRAFDDEIPVELIGQPPLYAEGVGINSAQAMFLSLATALAPTDALLEEASLALTDLVRRVVPAIREQP